MEHALPMLIEQARAERDAQSSRLVQARQVQERAQATLDRLQAFRADCLARAPAWRGTTDAATLDDHQRFLGTLDQALVQQTREVQLRASQADAQQSQLTAAQQRLLAFETLQRRYAQQRAARAARQDQRATDAFAALAAARRSSAP